MENSVSTIAETLYNRPRVTEMDTQVILTKGGNYVYRHVIAGNSRCDARIFNPETGEDKFCSDKNLFHYLYKFTETPSRRFEGGLLGKEVQEAYDFRN